MKYEIKGCSVINNYFADKSQIGRAIFKNFNITIVAAHF